MTEESVGRREKAIYLSRHAIRLNPFPQPYYFTLLGEELCLAEQYAEAIEAHKQALHLSPKYFNSILNLTVAYYLSGQEAKARARAGEILILYPRFSANG